MLNHRMWSCFAADESLNGTTSNFTQLFPGAIVCTVEEREQAEAGGVMNIDEWWPPTR